MAQNQYRETKKKFHNWLYPYTIEQGQLLPLLTFKYDLIYPSQFHFKKSTGEWNYLGEETNLLD